MDVFKEIASSIGHQTSCWYYNIGYDPITKRTLWDPDRGSLMCYVPHSVPEYSPTGMFLGNRHVSGDIFIRRSQFQTENPLLLPGADARFNICASAADGDSTAYKSFVHEVGHALGIGGSGAEKGGHSFSDLSSVVNYFFDEPDCAPHPGDIMALYALYQTR